MILKNNSHSLFFLSLFFQHGQIKVSVGFPPPPRPALSADQRMFWIHQNSPEKSPEAKQLILMQI